jgi:uncharacterized protein YrrD
MNRTIAVALVATLLLAVAATVVVAQFTGPPPQQPERPPLTQTPVIFVPKAPEQAAGDNGSMVALTEITSFALLDRDGQVMGTLENFFFYLERMEIAYAVLALGQGVDTSDRIYPVPPSALELRREQQAFAFVGDDQKLATAPHMTRPQIASDGVVNLPQDVLPFWAAGHEASAPVPGNSGATPAAATAAADGGTLVIGTQMIGFPVWSLPADRLGTIQDAIVDWEGERIAYVVIATGDALQPDKTLVPVPARALTYEANAKVFLLDADGQVLETAPSFEQTQWPDLSTADWDAEVEAFWAERSGGSGD